jgi:amidase
LAVAGTRQPGEAWETFRVWIERDYPRFALPVALVSVLGAAAPEAQRGWAALVRREARERLRQLLPRDGAVRADHVLPDVRDGAPPVRIAPIRDQILDFCAPDGLAGHPQVSIPGATVQGRPVELSLIAPRGANTLLVRTALAMETA